MLKELKLTSQKGDATLVLKQHLSAGRDGSSVVFMSIKTTSDYIGAGLTLDDVKALVEPGAGVRETPFSRRVYVGGTLVAVGYVTGEDWTRFHYPAPWKKTRQTIIDWLNAAITEFDTEKDPDVAITPTISTSYKITDSDGGSVEFFPTLAGGVRLLFDRRSFLGRSTTVTLDVTRSKALVKALRAAHPVGYKYTTIRPGGDRTLSIGHGWIDGPDISIAASEDEQTAAADFVEKTMGLSKAEPEAVAKDEPKFKVGDRVKIVGNPLNLDREPEVGREGTVMEVRDSFRGAATQFSVKPTVGTTWWYSASALEKIGESKPAPAPTPVKTAVPVFGPFGAAEAEKLVGNGGGTADAERFEAARVALTDMAFWGSTPEGFDFWSAIVRRIGEMDRAVRARTPTRRPDADYKSPCPVGYETLAMAMLRRGNPDDATAKLGVRVSRKAALRDLVPVWVEAPAVADDVVNKVRAYPRADLDWMLADLGIARA